MKSFICIVMAVLLTNAPHIVLAETAQEMIPTAAVVEEMSAVFICVSISCTDDSERNFL